MEIFLDAVFSSIYRLFIIWFLLLGLGYLLYKFWNTFTYEKLRNFLVFFFPTVVFLIMLVFYEYGNYGYVEKIASLNIVDCNLFFLDEKIKKSKFEGSRKVCRLYVVNLENGNLISRKMIGLNATTLKIIDYNIIFSKKWSIKKNTVEIKELCMYDNKTKLLTNDSLYIANLIESNSDKSNTFMPAFKIIKSGNGLKYNDTILNIRWEKEFPITKIMTNSKINHQIHYKGKLIFNIDNHVFCIHAANGNLIWDKEF